MSDEQVTIQAGSFKPGIYRHYKGALYLALFLTEDSNNGPNGEQSSQEPEVVYIALEGPKAGQHCNRKLRQWLEQVKVSGWSSEKGDWTKLVPRFEWVRP